MNFYEFSARAHLKFFTWRRGVLVGSDSQGNRYFREKRARHWREERRWVLYAGASEASRVPPEWHAWLHRQQEHPPAAENPWRRPWQKPHRPNLTGTSEAYLPPGHLKHGGQRPPTTGDYEPWIPN